MDVRVSHVIPRCDLCDAVSKCHLKGYLAMALGVRQHPEHVEVAYTAADIHFV